MRDSHCYANLVFACIVLHRFDSESAICSGQFFSGLFPLVNLCVIIVADVT